MDYSWYSRLLVRKHWLIIALVFFFSLSCITVPLVTDKLPNFTDPQAGFEARGTELAQRLRTWANLNDATSQLTNNPLEYHYYLKDLEQQKPTHKNKHKHQKNKSQKKHKKKHRKVHNDFTEDIPRIKRAARKKPSAFFCNDPIPDYARVVVGSKNDEGDLWTVNGMRAQCLIDSVLRTSTHFSSLCQMEGLPEDDMCCPTWSPANYVAFLSNRAACEDITEEDLSRVRKLLTECHVLYRKQDLVAHCAEDLTCRLRVPAACYHHGNAVYHMIHYLLDVGFFPKDKNDTRHRLSSAMMILPMAASSGALDYYRSLDIDNLIHSNFQVVGMQFGLKNLIFDQMLLADSFFLLFGFIFVTVCIWAYTGSFLITLSTIFAVVFSLAISFSFYRLVLRIQLFPFMNLLAVVVAVGIGSDDAFIFCKIWECTKREGAANVDATLVRLTHETLRHAVPAMFVSTLTTAVAFFASIVSNVTAINCFSIFSGTTVIVNFLLMITWLPACVLAAERLRCDRPMLQPLKRLVLQPLQLLVDRFGRLFTEALARVVVSLRWLWLVALGGLGVAACFVVFYRPGLQLPDSPGFQLLHAQHPFERYELHYVRRFYFERPKHNEMDLALPMHFVWGVLPVDNGDHLNPASRGSLVLDPSFNVTARESQQWLQRFCEQLRLQPFYRSTLGPLLPNCFIQSLRPWMERPCKDPIEPRIDRSPCCNSNPFPYEPRVLHECAAVGIAEVYRTPSYLWHYVPSQITAGLRFQKLNQSSEKLVPEIQALVVEYDSNFTFSFSFAEMDQFYRSVETWMREQLETAPPGLRNGWFVGDLEFYELQRTLYEGTIWSIVVSMGLAFTVLGLVTLNPFVSLYAILTVAAAIVVTVATLVLLGWRLNVLENVAVSTAIGLTVDFSMHYGVCYRSSTAEHRAQRVKEALDKMAGPTLMAALTTGAAGAMVLPSQVLAYIQIGLFLVIVMTVSWVYATFLLCPMLAAAGPSARVAPFRIFRSRRRRRQNADEQNEQESYPMEPLPSS